MKKNEKNKIEVETTSKEELNRMLTKIIPKKPEMKNLWYNIIKELKTKGFKSNGKNDIFLKNKEVAILINLQISAYDKLEYYINIGFSIRELKDSLTPKFYFDSSCFGRIQIDNQSQDNILNAIFVWINNYSSIENIKLNLPLDKPLYNSTKLEVKSFLNI